MVDVGIGRKRKPGAVAGLEPNHFLLRVDTLSFVLVFSHNAGLPGSLTHASYRMS